MINPYLFKIFNLQNSFLIVLLSCSTIMFSQENSIEVFPSTQKYIGSVSKLDRTKFFNLHSGAKDEDIKKFLKDYNVGIGRSFWGPFATAKQKTKKVGVYPDSKGNKPGVKKVIQNIYTGHRKTAFKDGIDVKKAGEWAAEYFKNYMKEPLPMYFEPLNEPFVHAKDFYDGKWNIDEINRIKKQMAEFYAACGKAIHNTPQLANMKVIGYSSAWPSMELNNFGHWDSSMKMFMDTAGKHMDGIATHLYDGINVQGQNNIRSGSNAEAILDMIETYSFIKWNKVKPHAISEFGAIEKGYEKAYSDVKSIQSIRSINHLLFSLLDREDRMLISIPFITGKAKWFINKKNDYHPYQGVLFRPKTIKKTDNPNRPILKNWTYTSRIHFYELWKDVKGERVRIKGSNPDIQYQAFVDENKLHIALSNLDDSPLATSLKINNTAKPIKIQEKSLKIFDKKNPKFKIRTLKETPEQINLLPHETIVLTYEYASKINFNSKIITKNTYSKNYLQSIISGKELTFSFKKVPTGKTGEAVLKMGIGRKHDKSKKPIILVNGKSVNIPTNWKGYDQKNRKDFFGVIDIPIALEYLKPETTVSVKFPDDSGHISSMIIQTKIEK